jgi:hypothetical protein
MIDSSQATVAVVSNNETWPPLASQGRESANAGSRLFNLSLNHQAEVCMPTTKFEYVISGVDLNDEQKAIVSNAIASAVSHALLGAAP